MPMFHPTSRRGDGLQVVVAERMPAIATKTPNEEKSRGRARTTRTGRIERRISRVSPGIAGRRRPGPGLSPAAAQGFADRHAEARALSRGIDVALRLRFLFHAEGLSAREPDALAAVLDREHGHLDLGARRQVLPIIDVLRRSHLRIGDEADLAGADAQEDAEGLDAL